METPKNKMSSPDHIVCPACESGMLRPRSHSLLVADCEGCGQALDRTFFRTLKQIATLGEALGEHACEECGHPEVFRMSDSVFACPACRSEVVPAGFSDHPGGGFIEGSSIYDPEQQAVPEPLLDTMLNALHQWINLRDRPGRTSK